MNRYMQKKIRDFLPTKKERVKKILCQGRVPSTLRDAVQSQRKKDGLTWDELLTGMLRLYLSETKK